MTIIQALSGYYDRMAARGEAEPPGFSREKIGFAVVVDADGEVRGVDDLRDTTGKKSAATPRDVPASKKRTVAVVPNFFWDKTAYSLGVTAGEGKRTVQEHGAFRDLHLRLLADAADEGLVALRRFLEGWEPERFAEPPFTPDMLDANIVFRLDGDADEAGRPRFIHQRPAALPLIEARGGDGAAGLCLVTGVEATIARLHPSIKGVDGAQTAGAALVSFNLDAFSSWGRKQGANAPTGEAVAARYGAALNRLLDRNGRNRLRIGDASVAFWADTTVSGEAAAQASEALMASIFGVVGKAETGADRDHDAAEAFKVRAALEPLADGRPVSVDGVDLLPGTRMYVLGLSPNAARLSVRFWLSGTLGDLACHLSRHERDCRIEPLPRHWGAGPSINRLLVKTTAAQEKWDNIPPLLAGEVARAVLGGTPYPLTLLSNALMRVRAGDDPATGWHAAAIRAVLQRLGGKGAPMSLDKEETNAAYRLGRLFAVLEETQERALGRVNATIRDRYFGAASATPAGIFPLLLRGVQNHLAKLRKDEPGAAQGVEIKLGEIMGGLAPALPRSLRLEDQGRFAIGYYHQRSERFRKREEAGGDQQGGTHD